MIKGMTGFGSAELSTSNVKITAEIKTVNHRYFDLSFYLPVGFNSFESKIRQLVAKSMERGRMTISLKITQKSSQSVSLNKDVVKQYIKHTQLLQKEFGLRNDVTTSQIIKLPGVFNLHETILDPESLWADLEKIMIKSLKSVNNMRMREGRALCVDIMLQANRMLLEIKNIKKRSGVVLSAMKKEVTEEEYKSFEKSIDVNEELARLKHYIEELKALLKSDLAVGKKIDFIAQEMQRETNTIGSKLQDKIVSSAVITLKSMIEKIREQSQNVE